MNQPTIHILLSTYNGENHLKVQLDSLLKQTYSNFTLHVRDDGSTDKTLEILKYWEKKFPQRFYLDQSNNVGVVKSFFSLVKNVEYKTGDFFAFCDQDDVWEPNKLQLAADAITSGKHPQSSLYCSRLEYVDDKLQHLHHSLVPKTTSFSNAVVENIATGCTVVFGENIRDYLLQGNPDHMMMHDWWAYLIASAFGNVIYDQTPTIKYRQHASSVTPWEHGLVKVYNRGRGFFRRLLKRSHQGLDSLNQATHFVQTYEDIPEKHEQLVQELLALRQNRTLFNRVKYIINPRVLRTDPIENFLLKPMILFRMH